MTALAKQKHQPKVTAHTVGDGALDVPPEMRSIFGTDTELPPDGGWVVVGADPYKSIPHKNA